MLDELQNGYQWASQHVILCVHVCRGAKKKQLAKRRVKIYKGKKINNAEEKILWSTLFIIFIACFHLQNNKFTN